MRANIATVTDHEETGKFIEAMKEEMTPAHQIEEVQKLARACVRKQYKGR